MNNRINFENNSTYIAVIFFIVLLIICSSLFIFTPLISPNESQNQTQNYTTDLSEEQTLSTHIQSLQNTTSTYTLTQTASVNTTQIYTKQIQNQRNQTIIQYTSIDNTSYTIWQNQTTAYQQYSNQTVTQVPRNKINTTGGVLLTRLFYAGDYWYTNNTTENTTQQTFAIRNITNTQALLTAHPLLSSSSQGTITNATITGTQHNDTITTLSTQFTYTQPSNISAKYTINYTITQNTPTQPKPDWIS